MTRFVFFDAAGTLIRPHPSVGAVYASAGRTFGLSASPDALTRAFSKRFSWYTARVGPTAFLTDDGAASRAWWHGLVRQVLLDVGFRGDTRAVFEACYSAFEKPEAWRVFDDVRSTLGSLRARGLRLGVLSNGDIRLDGLLERLELKQRFDAVVVSCREGFAKPDPRLFIQATQRAGVPPSEIAHVGDRADLDLEPALRAGWNAFLIDREGREVHRPRSLRSLDDLLTRV